MASIANFGKLIKPQRIKKGYSIPELADKVQVTEMYIWYLENGQRKPSIQTIDKLCQVLDIDIEFIRKV